MQVKTCENCYFDKDGACTCKSTCLHHDMWQAIYPDKNKTDDVKTEKVLKDDAGKLRWDLLPMDAIEKIVDIYTFGLRDHEEESWKKVDQKRYYAALMRHLVEWKKGVPIDPDSKRSHLAHMAWNAIAMLWHEIQKEQSESERKTCVTCKHLFVMGCNSSECLSNDYSLWESKVDSNK